MSQNLRSNGESIGKKAIGKYLLLGFVFWLCLGFFLHFEQVPLEILELNKVAERYIIGQTDFEFPDDEATIILRQDAIRDIHAIYKIDESQISQIRSELQNGVTPYFPETTSELKGKREEEIQTAFSLLSRLLQQSRFGDLKTVKRLVSLKIADFSYFTLNSRDFKERALPKEFRDYLIETFVRERISSEVTDVFIRVFQKQKWKFVEDIETENLLKKQIKEMIPQKFSRIEAGNYIIQPGERVTSRHITMLQAMKQALGQVRQFTRPQAILASGLLSLMFILISMIYLRAYHRAILNSLQKLTLLSTIALMSLLIAKICEYLILNASTVLIDFARYPLFVPFAAILTCILLGAELALFMSGFLSVIMGVFLTVRHDRFIILNLAAAVIVIVCSRGLHKRKQMFGVCFKAYLVCIPFIIAFNLFQNIFWSTFLLNDFLGTFIFTCITSLLSIAILPLLESAFDVMTDMTLMEHMDPNNQLLRRLSIEAPGTYQHSLVVGNLAETVARSINANGLFCRVATLYHDIGKLFNPHYFTENQLGGFDIHRLLTPVESAQVIIAHVTEGEALARKHHLPESFIDIIKEHHGTTLVYYFYHKYLEQMKDEHFKIEEFLFRYPGPKPHSKESAIIMIVDTIEAASRSLSDIDEMMLTKEVDKLINEKYEEGQFDECRLTFEELGIIKKTLVKSLIVTRHLRIKYPQKN